MGKTGRYWIIDKSSGRKFCIEPIANRSQKLNDKAFDNGGITDIKGGAIREEESIITEENGFKNIYYTSAGESPDSFVDALLKNVRYETIESDAEKMKNAGFDVEIITDEV